LMSAVCKETVSAAGVPPAAENFFHGIQNVLDPMIKRVSKKRERLRSVLSNERTKRRKNLNQESGETVDTPLATSPLQQGSPPQRPLRRRRAQDLHHRDAGRPLPRHGRARSLR